MSIKQRTVFLKVENKRLFLDTCWFLQKAFIGFRVILALYKVIDESFACIQSPVTLKKTLSCVVERKHAYWFHVLTDEDTFCCSSQLALGFGIHRLKDVRKRYLHYFCIFQSWLSRKCIYWGRRIRGSQSNNPTS